MSNNLNKDFFDEDDNMHPDVLDNLRQIARDVLVELQGMDVDLDPFVGLTLTGSMLTTSWDESSDLDLHILYTGDDDGDEVPGYFKEFLQYFAKAFNSNEFEINGHPVEIYFQDIDEPHKALSLYDVARGEWIKPPYKEPIEFTDEVKDRAGDFKQVVDDFIKYYPDSGKQPEDLLEEAHAIYKRIRDFRALANDKYGEDEFPISFENMVFKWLRRTGTIHDIIEAMRDIKELVYNT